MRLSLSQINVKVGDFEANYRKIMVAVKRAAQHRDHMVIFPELSLCGYLHRDSIERAEFLAQSEKYLRLIAEHAPANLYVVVGTPIRHPTHDGQIQNACVVIHNHRIVHQQAKTALPHYDIFDELRYYAPADTWGVFTVEGKVCGIAICEDVWRVEGDSVDHLRSHGLGDCKLPLDALDVLIVCSASPYEKGKLARRLVGVRKCCTTFNIDAVYVNTVGAEDGILFDGRSFAMNRSGVLTALSPMYEEHHQTVSIPARSAALPVLPMPIEERYADIYASLAFGVREYVHKNGFKRVVFGLSGGIDSAVTAVIAAEALGADNVHALVMPSPYSSSASMEDAQTLIETLGLPHTTLPITDIFSQCRALLQKSMYDGHDVDITEQNIQARIRGMLIMAHANLVGALPLATGNKSELAVGYCTQYGDMVGALAVIGDLYKCDVYRLARYLNRITEVIPTTIIEKPPSAELKPDQTDEDTLPPYAVLDAVLERYIEEGESVAQIVGSGIDEPTVRSIIRLHHRSEHKRNQAPPVVRVSKKAFGIGRRMLVSRAAFELS